MLYILTILTDVVSMRCQSDRMADGVRVIVSQDNNQFNASIPEPSERTEQTLKFVLSLPHIYCGTMPTYIHTQTHVTQIHIQIKMLRKKCCF